MLRIKEALHDEQCDERTIFPMHTHTHGTPSSSTHCLPPHPYPPPLAFPGFNTHTAMHMKNRLSVTYSAWSKLCVRSGFAGKIA